MHPPRDYADSDDYKADKAQTLAYRSWLCLKCIAIGAAVVWIVWSTGAAWAHEAPSGKWTYPPGCCRSAEEPGGDCAPIDDRYVTSGPDGYHINLPKGAHPKLHTKGYSGVVPYPLTKVSPDGQTHICLSTDGGTRYCFFKNPPGV